MSSGPSHEWRYCSPSGTILLSIISMSSRTSGSQLSLSARLADVCITTKNKRKHCFLSRLHYTRNPPKGVGLQGTLQNSARGCSRIWQVEDAVRRTVDTYSGCGTGRPRTATVRAPASGSPRWPSVHLGAAASGWASVETTRIRFEFLGSRPCLIFTIAKEWPQDHKQCDTTSLRSILARIIPQLS